ncbi:hypothetical protein PPYR_07055 [Photinus pyralis]|uniref:Phospholipid scramblase n=1 Tax=Photinus pyralis TaxID=7054 RepID=A0A1Y1KT52_PHOPY|nr:hypothetical protein PPYR_07055 [Photinus pyralis]
MATSNPAYTYDQNYNVPHPYMQPPSTAGQQNAPAGFYPPPQSNIGHSLIIHQPQGVSAVGPQWSSVPLRDCPPGLEYLTMIDQLIVSQKVELLEALVGFETQNKYAIKNSLGQKVYYALEDSDCLTRNCCGPIRPFEMNILDTYRNEVMHFHRPLACTSCWFPCCLQEMEVSSPPGTIIGTVEQKWSILFPSFVIKNANGDVVLRIDGPFCTASCCCQDVVFNVYSADGQTKVGKIYKQWSGLIKEGFTDADNFGVTFPIDFDVRIKATLIGALFLIDFMFFETTRARGHSIAGMV